MQKNRNECRMYPALFPNVDELVMVQVKQVSEMGVYVSILEYANLEGMILKSDLSMKRIRSIRRLTQVGLIQVAIVLRVDQQKGYVDLSRKQISFEQAQQTQQRYKQSLFIHSMVRQVAEKIQVSMLELYESFVWDLYQRFGHAYEACKQIKNNHHDDVSFILESYPNVSPDMKQTFLQQVLRRFHSHPVKIRSEIQLNCFGPCGIDGIKDALRAAYICSPASTSTNVQDNVIEIKLISSPLYIVFITSTDQEQGMKIIQLALQQIKQTIQSYEGGEMIVKLHPTIVTEHDDKALANRMLQIEKDNQEIDADDQYIEGM